MTEAAWGADDDSQVVGPVTRPKRLQINPEALRVVAASRRKFWEQMAADVEIEVASKFRKKWSTAETVRVILATPDETYEDVAAELGRTPGAVRYRRMAMVHLLREEHGAPERVRAFLDDPKANHKFADYHQVHEALVNLGLLDLPISQQFQLATELRQPSKGWRGDGTAAALAGGSVLRDEVKRLLQEARRRNGRDDRAAE